LKLINIQTFNDGTLNIQVKSHPDETGIKAMAREMVKTIQQ